MPFHVTFGMELPVLTVSAITYHHEQRLGVSSTAQLKVVPAVLQNHTQDMQDDQDSTIWQEPSGGLQRYVVTAKDELIHIHRLIKMPKELISPKNKNLSAM